MVCGNAAEVVRASIPLTVTHTHRVAVYMEGYYKPSAAKVDKELVLLANEMAYAYWVATGHTLPFVHTHSIVAVAARVVKITLFFSQT